MSARLTYNLETKHLTTSLLRRRAGRVLTTKQLEGAVVNSPLNVGLVKW